MARGHSIAHEPRMLYQISSSRPLDEIERDLEQSAARNSFGIIAVLDLQKMLKDKGVDLAMECRVYEVCNPQQAKRVLEADGAVSTTLPCRISLYGSGGHYTLATIRPTELMKAFGDTGMEEVAQEVEHVIFQMMRDAAGALTGAHSGE